MLRFAVFMQINALHIMMCIFMNKLYITSATGFEIYERIIHQSAYQAI